MLNYDTLFQSLPDQYLVLSPNFKIVEATNAFLEATNVSRLQITGKAIFDIAPYNKYDAQSVEITQLRNSLTEVIQEKRPDNPPPQKFTALLQPGILEDRYRKISNSPVLNEAMDVTFIIHRIADITETVRLKDADRVKDEFFSNVAHDLRAPLHVISGYAQILLGDYGDKLDADGLQNLDNIKRQSIHMADLIANLSAFARAANKVLVPDHIDMRDLVLDALSQVKNNYREFHTEIKLGNLPACTCDPQLMQQAWYQLISNAAKFSAGKPEPVIEIGSETSDGQLIFYVKDNGVGFDMDYVHKLFQPFERLHHESDFPGTGLGLALAHRIIEKHCGKIWAEAKENDQASFYFTLPGQSSI